MNDPVKATPEPRQPAPIVPMDPVIAVKSKITGAVIGFVKQNPWKAAAMVAAAGLVFVLSGGAKSRM